MIQYQITMNSSCYWLIILSINPFNQSIKINKKYFIPTRLKLIDMNNISNAVNHKNKATQKGKSH